MPERVIRLKEIVKIKEKEETMSSIPSERIQ
jgi:hypothetical protein